MRKVYTKTVICCFNLSNNTGDGGGGDYSEISICVTWDE